MGQYFKWGLLCLASFLLMAAVTPGWEGFMPLPSAQIVVGDANGRAQGVALSGDATMSNLGAITVSAGSIEGSMLVEGVVNSGAANKYVYIQGSHVAPVCSIKIGSAATGADTSITNCHLGQDLPPMVIYNTGNNTTNIAPQTIVDAAATDGFYLPSTNADNVGGTITFGASMLDLAATAGGDTTFKVGTDGAFYLKAKVGIPDVSDYDVLCIGFVEPAAAYVAAIDSAGETVTSYDEKAVFCLGDNAGDVDTIASVGGTDDDNDITVTDWTDDDVMTMEVDVSAAGVITFRWWDAVGDEDTTLGASEGTFAADTVVTPVIIFAKCANIADTPPIVEYITWGLQ